ncbi:insulinase family protein [candidate division WOR-3 bacterium]|nr:insulinase family protein [candidate division WOR-3 bacterium]
MFILLFLSIVGSNSGLKITRKTLENDLRVIFIEDHTSPIFGGIVQFDIGSAYERPGITGTSHLLEHMLFKGTKKMGTVNYKKEAPIIEEIHKLYSRLDRADSVENEKILKEIDNFKGEQEKYAIPAEIWSIYSREGGTWMNAFTSNTTTQYFILLPSNKKEVWAKIESDRFQNPVLREFYSERDVVNEERRMYESRSGSVLWDHLVCNSYIASPVRWSVIGWTSDIMNVTPEEVMEYYKAYYVPERCVIVLAGDVDPEEDFKMVQKYFGKWEKRNAPLIRLTEEPQQNGIRRAHVNFKASPQMAIGFHGPLYGEKEYYAARVLVSALTTGRSSIFEKTLVNTGMASEINVHVDNWDGKAKSLIYILTHPMKDVSFNTIEDKIFSVLDSLKENGISKKDLRRARNNFKMNLLRRRRYILWFAFGVGNGERVMGDPEFYKKELEMIDSITANDVMNALKEYINKDKSTIVTLGEERI